MKSLYWRELNCIRIMYLCSYSKREGRCESSTLETVPNYPADVYKCKSDLPNIKMVFQIMCTLPVIAGIAEHLFSALCWLTTYLRTATNKFQFKGHKSSMSIKILPFLYRHRKFCEQTQTKTSVALV